MDHIFYIKSIVGNRKSQEAEHIYYETFARGQRLGVSSCHGRPALKTFPAHDIIIEVDFLHNKAGRRGCGTGACKRGKCACGRRLSTADRRKDGIQMGRYDVIIIGAGPGGIFAAYELMQKAPELKTAVFEAGSPLEKRKCPIDGKKVKSCINCKTCAIMSGFGGAGAFSDGKYNITNDFGGTLYEYIGKETATGLMHFVDEINHAHGGEGSMMYTTALTQFKKLCLQNNLTLLHTTVRPLRTDIN